MIYLVIIVLILGLTPAVLYVLGAIKDPFHPLIFFGVASYLIIAHKLLTNPKPALAMIAEEHFNVFLVVTIISMLGFYAGWFKGNKKVSQAASTKCYSLNMNKMLGFGSVALVISLASFALTRNSVAASGYLADPKHLWCAVAVLMVQVLLYATNPQQRMYAAICLMLSLVPALDRFIVYGQRSETFRVFCIFGLFYLARNKRPSKAVFISAAVIAGLILGVMVQTRSIVNSNPSFGGRVEAIFEAIPHFFDQETSYVGGEEFLFGTGAVAAVRDTGRYGYGKGFTVVLLQRFAPKEIFPNKWQWFTSHAGYEKLAIMDAVGLEVSGGAAPSGFAHVFCEVSWACPLVWFVFGFFTRRLWDNATRTGSIEAQGLFVNFALVLLLALSQDVFMAEVYAIFTMLPLYLIYRWCRVPEEPAPYGNLDASPSTIPAPT